MEEGSESESLKQRKDADNSRGRARISARSPFRSRSRCRSRGRRAASVHQRSPEAESNHRDGRESRISQEKMETDDAIHRNPAIDSSRDPIHGVSLRAARSRDWYLDHEISVAARDWNSGFGAQSFMNTRVDEGRQGRLNAETASRTVRRWLETCDANHVDHCRPETSATVSQYGRPNWVIDVRRWCLQVAGPSCQYVALSYVWGRSWICNATTLNVDTLQIVGRLEDLELPAVIRDSMEFTRCINIQYLWVDCLCIVQDDELTKNEQISHMAEVYAGAYMTLVAASGHDASHGLWSTISPDRVDEQISSRYGRSPGYDDVSTYMDLWARYRYENCRRQLPPQLGDGERYRGENSFIRPNNRYMTYVDDPITTAGDKHDALLSKSPWMTRAWTFQELMFSQRLVFVFDEALIWECHCAIWDRHTGVEAHNPCKERYSESARNYRYTAWPDLEEYTRLMCDFNTREMSFEEDVERAFAGITTMLSCIFMDGFLYGLPQLFFDVTLLWQPRGNMKRRRPQRITHLSTSIPSWSWMGWKGPIDPLSWALAYDYVHENKRGSRIKNHWRSTSWQLRPTVQWTFSNEANNPLSLHTPLIHTLQLYRQHATSSDFLPPGWSRIRPRNSDTAPLFTYLDDVDTVFKYPIPTCPIPQTSRTTAPSAVPLNAPKSPLSPYLFCHTRRAKLMLLWLPWRDSASASVRDVESVQWAGVLHLHHKEDLKKHVDAQGFVHFAFCELIEVSAGSVDNSHDESEYIEEWNDRERPKDTGLYEFYNVLWIEWKDGIAYRRACGRVLKEFWERCAVEYIDLTLG